LCFGLTKCWKGDFRIENVILAVITMNLETVGGGAPIFYVKEKSEMESLALSLSNIVNGTVHEPSEDVFVIVKH